MKFTEHMWLEDYNSFDMFEEYNGKTLIHYCNSGSLIGILENKCFWASNIKDFNDPNEGKLAYEHVCNNMNSIVGRNDSLEKKEDFMFSKCYVACFSKDEKSEYMRKAFMSRKSDGEGRKIEIVLDARKFIDSLFCKSRTEKELKNFRIKCIKYIVGNGEVKILGSIEQYLKELWRKMKEDPLIDKAYATELIKRKAFYIGTFIKKEDEKIPVSHEEQEVRVLINVFNPEIINDKCEAYVDSHVENKKEYVNFYFDLNAIEKIIVLDQSEYDNVLSLIEHSMKLESNMKKALREKVVFCPVQN